jgi:hypothetical protein
MRCACLLLATTLFAQELPELSTERPGFTASSGAVGRGVLQLEQGYTFQSVRNGGSDQTTFTAPQALVRFGITDALELRFSTNGYSWQGQGLSDGPNDYLVGAKLRFLKQRAARPEVSIIGGVSLPAYGSPFTTSGHDPAFTLAAGKDLPGKFNLAANATMASITDARGRLLGSGESFSASKGVGGGVSLFAEAFRTTINRQEGSAVSVDGGLSRSLGRHAQIDIGGGRTVSGVRTSWFATAGCVFRIPRALLR